MYVAGVSAKTAEEYSKNKESFEEQVIQLQSQSKVWSNLQCFHN